MISFIDGEKMYKTPAGSLLDMFELLEKLRLYKGYLSLGIILTYRNKWEI